MNRNFTIQSSSLGVKGGRYSDIVPINVAKKVAKNLFKNYKISKIVLCIRETTKNSKKKQYHYIAIRKKHIIKVKSNNKTIRGGGSEEGIFNKRREARIALCNFMVDFVLHCGGNNDTITNFAILDGVVVKDERYYNTELSEQFCNLFSRLLIIYRKEKEEKENFFFILDSIFLKKDEDGEVERGGNLLYAIMQGLKMGIILLAQRNNNISYCLIIPNQLKRTISYLQKIEQFLEYYGKHTIMHLTKCDDNIHFYWNIDWEYNDNIKYDANGKGHPLIIYNKEPLFMPDSKSAILISEHVISLVFEIISKNILSWSSETISDVLVQAVFQSLRINILNDTLDIKMVYNEAFIKINIIGLVMEKLFDICNKIQNITIKRIRVLQCCGDECQTQNKDIISNFKDNSFH